jgi:Rieske Fe-S protein
MSDNHLSRRQALTLAAATACGCALTQTEILAQDGGKKSQRGGDDKTPMPTSLVIGKLSDFPEESFYDTFAKSKVYVRRLDDRLVVMSAICTHKGCALKQDEPDRLRCPCHRSSFNPQGTPTTDGPAKVALARYALKQADDGTITVDLTQSYSEKEWDKPGAMIPIPKS